MNTVDQLPQTPPPFAVLFDCALTGKPEVYQYFTTEAAAQIAAPQIAAAGYPGATAVPSGVASWVSVYSIEGTSPAHRADCLQRLEAGRTAISNQPLQGADLDAAAEQIAALRHLANR